MPQAAPQVESFWTSTAPAPRQRGGSFEGETGLIRAGVALGRPCVFGRQLLIRHLRGWVGAEPIQPRASASVSKGPQLSLPNAADRGASGLSRKATRDRSYAALLGRPVGKVSSTDRRQPRFHRSLRNQDTAWGRVSYLSDPLPGISPGFQSAANAAAALSRGRKPMGQGCQESSRVGGGSHSELKILTGMRSMTMSSIWTVLESTPSWVLSMRTSSAA